MLGSRAVMMTRIDAQSGTHKVCEVSGIESGGGGNSARAAEKLKKILPQEFQTEKKLLIQRMEEKTEKTIEIK